jgi:hypothetical protein
MWIWLIVIAVVVALGALAWWSSGRNNASGLGSSRMRRSISDSQSDVSMRAGRPGRGPQGNGPIG